MTLAIDVSAVMSKVIALFGLAALAHSGGTEP